MRQELDELNESLDNLILGKHKIIYGRTHTTVNGNSSAIISLDISGFKSFYGFASQATGYGGIQIAFLSDGKIVIMNTNNNNLTVSVNYFAIGTKV